ncbi:MAG: DUF4114 domain-containing protein [Planctomycetes bacterium]|nr:DUF4114 domain-containing protein [Planctomycetota bacterium]
MIAGNRLYEMRLISGGTAIGVRNLTDPTNPLAIPGGTAVFGYLRPGTLIVAGTKGYFSTNLVILQGGNVTHQFGDVIAVDLASPFQNVINDVLYNTFGDTNSGDETFFIQPNGGPFNMFDMAMPDANTLYVASTTSAGDNVTTDPSGNPAVGLVRIVAVTNPSNLFEVTPLAIPGTMMVQSIALDGNRAYVIGSQGPWRDPYTNASDIGPVGNLVMAVLDISDIRNPTVIGAPTILNRSARGLSMIAVGGNRFVLGSLGALTDAPQLFLIDAGDPNNLVVQKQITIPGRVRRMSVDGDLLYTATDAGMFIYSLGNPDVPVTAQVQIPNNTGVEIVPGSFNVAPTNIIDGVDFDTLVWEFTFDQMTADKTFTWDTVVSNLQPGESRPVTLNTTIDFVAQGTAGQVTLPPEEVFAEQVLSLNPATRTVRPGEAGQFTVTIHNPSTLDVTYDLAVQGVPQEWVSIAGQATVVGGASVEVPLTLTAGPFTPLGDFEFVVTAVNGAGSSVTGALTVAGDPVLPAAQPEARGVFFTLTPAEATAGQGTTARYRLRITNTGSITDTFAIEVQAAVGTIVQLQSVSVEVPPGASNFREVELLLTPAAGSPVGTQTFDVLVRSTTQPDVQHAVQGTLAVVAQGVNVEMTTRQGPPVSTFQARVTNTGNSADTFDLRLAGPPALVATLDRSLVALAPGESTLVDIAVGAIDFAYACALQLVVMATSRSNPDIADADAAEVIIAEHTGLATTFTPATKMLTAPGATSFLLIIQNTGNVEEAYEVSILSTTGPLTASINGQGGKPTQVISVIRIPGLHSGAVLVNAALAALQQGDVTVAVRSLTSDAAAAPVATIQVPRPNVPPVARADKYAVNENTLLRVGPLGGVLANDTDADNDELSARLVRQVRHGRLAFAADGSFSYRPNRYFHGKDTFQYVAYDAHGPSAVKTVTLVVRPVVNALILQKRTFLVPGMRHETVTVRFDWVIRRAGYNNEVGVVRVDDADGRIGNKRPGDPGYLQAALAAGRWQRVFGSGMGAGAVRHLTFRAGERFMVYIVQNASTEAALRPGPSRGVPPAFFMNPRANSDGFDHVRITKRGATTWLAWEDQTGGGDKDFNDVVMTVRAV